MGVDEQQLHLNHFFLVELLYDPLPCCFLGCLLSCFTLHGSDVSLTVFMSMHTLQLQGMTAIEEVPGFDLAMFSQIVFKFQAPGANHALYPVLKPWSPCLDNFAK